MARFHLSLTPVTEFARAWDSSSCLHFGRPEMAKFLKLIKNEEGATAIEYGLIAALIAVAAIGAMQGIGNRLNTTFNNVSNHLPSS
jgi:pilus assembly protein Flp/PilA